MQRKGHPYRQRQISTTAESGATDQNAKEVSTDQTVADWQSGLHKVTSSESRVPDLQVTQHSRKDTIAS